MRLFTALTVPADVAAECARVGELFPVDAVKRVGPELMHLTLAFIGYVPDDRAPLAAAALRSAVGRTGPIACRLGAPGAFPSPTRPRVVWIGLDEGAEAVRRCAVTMREELRAAGVPFDDKPPLAHLTVARVREGIPATSRAAIADALRAARVEPRRFSIDEAVLFESRLARRGPTYLPLERVSLRRALA